jgi:hypothetical protein
MTLKERFLKIKAAFDGTPPSPAPAPVPTPAPAAMAAKVYKTKEGVEISIAQAGELPATGDMVTIAGAPATEGTLLLEDGSTITVDATGAITVYTAAPAPAPAAPPAPPQPVTLTAQADPLTAESVAAMYAKFATGTPEERLANLEVMVKSLMESNYGWKIREGNENQAIQVYKDTIAPAAAAPVVSIEQMNSAFAKADEQAKVIARHEETIKGTLDLVEQLVELPTADPATLTGHKKEKFERQNDKEARIQKMADAVQAMKAEAKK